MVLAVRIGVTRLLPVVPVFQLTVPTQPLAVSVALVPEQIVADVTTRLTGGCVVTITEAVAEQLVPTVQVAL